MPNTKKKPGKKQVRPVAKKATVSKLAPKKLPNVWQLTKSSAQLLWRYKRLFIAITLIYGLLSLVLVQGLASSTDVAGLKKQLNDVFTGNFKALSSSLSIFVVLLGSAGNSNSQTAGAYQLFLAIITSLALIWALRHVLLGNTIRARDAFYRGMTPLVPFILVLIVIGLQTLPLVIGSSIYGLVISNGIAVHLFEKVLWAALFGLSALVTFYLLSSSVFALYIVTLADMTPRRALRSARELVKKRRWSVVRKLLALPFILIIVAAIIMVPIIILLTPLAQWIFFLLTMFSLAAVHTYIYSLYRSLLDE
jgi:hypothetical protein